MNILVWGAGRYCQYVMDFIRPEANILAIIDSNEELDGTRWKDSEISIINPDRIDDYDYEYIVVSTIKFDSIKAECYKRRLSDDKLIFFWEDKTFPNFIFSWTDRLLCEKRKADIYRARLDSAPYEWGLKKVPKLKSSNECIREIIEKRCSLCRFGDGEYNIILGEKEPWFQKGDSSLAQRLDEVLYVEKKGVLVAIAQNFECFDQYTEEAADEIRLYMEGDKREKIIKLLNPGKQYYDAYLSRPYLIYRDKEGAKTKFDLLKNIWRGRNVIVVEGKYTRFGVGNDLLAGVESIARIICPHKNAWDKYEKIFETVKKNANFDTLVCASLGPVATVLAYDLATYGIQTIDIGQLDNEYEWYIHGAKERTLIKGKMVAEFVGHPIPQDKIDIEYKSQIAEDIS